MKTVLQLFQEQFPEVQFPVWNYKVYGPMSLDDSAGINIRIQYVERGPWEHFDFQVSTGTWTRTKDA